MILINTIYICDMLHKYKQYLKVTAIYYYISKEIMMKYNSQMFNFFFCKILFNLKQTRVVVKKTHTHTHKNEVRITQIIHVISCLHTCAQELQ